MLSCSQVMALRRFSENLNSDLKLEVKVTEIQTPPRVLVDVTEGHGHPSDAFVDVCCVILDYGTDTYSMQGLELPCLDVIGFHLLLWQAYYVSTVPDHGQGIGIDSPDSLFLPFH